MSAKPIFIIWLPTSLFDRDLQLSIKNNIAAEMTDYHVISASTSFAEIRFEVFYEKDHKPIDYEGLKKLIEDARQ